MQGKCGRSDKPARQASRLGRERNYSWHVPASQQNRGQHFTASRLKGMWRFSVRFAGRFLPVELAGLAFRLTSRLWTSRKPRNFLAIRQFYYQIPALRGLVRFESGN